MISIGQFGKNVSAHFFFLFEFHSFLVILEKQKTVFKHQLTILYSAKYHK